MSLVLLTTLLYPMYFFLITQLFGPFLCYYRYKLKRCSYYNSSISEGKHDVRLLLVFSQLNGSAKPVEISPSYRMFNLGFFPALLGEKGLRGGLDLYMFCFCMCFFYFSVYLCEALDMSTIQAVIIFWNATSK